MARLRARIIEAKASSTPLFVILESEDGEPGEEWAARVQDARAKAAAAKATGQRAFVLVIDGVEADP